MSSDEKWTAEVRSALMTLDGMARTSYQQQALRTIKDALMVGSILDAEGDGGVVGDPILIEVVGRVERDTAGELDVNWSLEGGIHALEEGAYLFCADREITDDDGYGLIYTHPARSGVVSDEDVEAACIIAAAKTDATYPWAVYDEEERERSLDFTRAALEHFAAIAQEKQL